MARDVSEREFVNYVRGAGGFIGYSDANEAVKKIFAALKGSFDQDQEKATKRLFPESVYKLWESIAANEAGGEYLQRIQEHISEASLDKKDKRYYLSVLSALSEKLQENAELWASEIFADQGRKVWELSKSITPCQNAREFL